MGRAPFEKQNASMTLKAIKLVLSEIHEKVKVERIFADHHDRRMTRSMKRLVSISLSKFF